jgi:hypothetical protein
MKISAILGHFNQLNSSLFSAIHQTIQVILIYQLHWWEILECIPLPYTVEVGSLVATWDVTAFFEF